MYQELKSNSQSVQPEHLCIAMDFANSMLERFQPHEANEMLKLIRQRWSEQRMMDIEKSEKHITYIKDSLSDL